MAVAEHSISKSAAVYTQERAFARTWRRFRKQRLAFFSLIGFVILVLLIIFVPVFSPFSYKAQNIFQQYATAGSISQDAGLDVKGGLTYWFGSDDYGRDEFTRLFFAGRISLSVALIATLIILAVGTLIGGLAGYFGGLVDNIYMGFTDFILAFPALPTLLLLSRIIPVGAQYTWADGDFYQTMDQALKSALGYSFVFVILGWVPISRQVRASVTHTLTLDFVEAARALGAGGWRIFTKHLLPTAMGVILLTGVITVGQVIIYESILSYLGMGVIQPIPTWGNMIKDAQQQMWFVTNSLNPFEEIRGWLLFLPGLMILISVVSINFIAEGLRDALSGRQ